MPITLIDILKQKNRQQNVNSGSFFFMVDSPDVNFKINGIQTDDTLNPSLTIDSRYIVQDISNINTNFGPTAGWTNNDIVRYNGTNFEILLSALNQKQSGTLVFNDEDKKFYGFDGTNWFSISSNGTGLGQTGPTGPKGEEGPIGPTGPTGPGYINAEIRNSNLFITEIFPDGTTNEIDLGYVGPTGSEFIFDENLVANFKDGKSFGRFLRGDSVDAVGKSAVQIIKEAFTEPLEPLVFLSATPTSIPFNQTSPTIILNFNYEIESQDASASSADLEFRIGSSSSWESLTSGIGLTTFTHTPTIPSANTQPLSYRYIVVDTDGASASTTTSVAQTQYLSIAFQFAQSKPTTSNIENLLGNSVTLRERENTETRLSGSPSSNANIVITNRNNSSLVPLRNWAIEKKIDGGDWISLTGQSGSFETATINISSFIDFSPNSNNFQYRIIASDDFSQNASTAPEIKVVSPIFFGSSDELFSQYGTDGNSLRQFVLDQNRQTGAIVAPSSNTFTMTEFQGDRSMFVALPTPIAMTNALNTTLNQQYFSETSGGFTSFDGITSIPLHDSFSRNYTVYVFSLLGPAGANSTIRIDVTGQANPQ